MGAIGRALANSLTTGGVVSASAINNTSVTNVTTLPSGADTGDLVLISSQTASASATISFTTGLDSTYDEYIFKFINIHPSGADNYFTFNMSTDSGSNYNVTKTTTFFLAQHGEDGTGASLEYQTGNDLAQSTGFQRLSSPTGNQDADKNISGSLTLFNPSSTTYVKHFMSVSSNLDMSNYSIQTFTAGYGNTTSAVNAVRFQMSSGNIDAGTISLYGVKKS
jgi:hypothetical protein